MTTALQQPSGWALAIDPRRIDKAGTVHTTDVSKGVSPQAFVYGAPVRAPKGTSARGSGLAMALACGCRPFIHRFKCESCGLWVGWCFGCADEAPGWCDHCWMTLRQTDVEHLQRLNALTEMQRELMLDFLERDGMEVHSRRWIRVGCNLCRMGLLLREIIGPYHYLFTVTRDGREILDAYERGQRRAREATREEASRKYDGS